MNIFDKLPDELLLEIHKFQSVYLLEIPRWNKKIKRWRKHPNIKCTICKQHSSVVALAEIDDKLLCWSCAH